MAGNEIVVPESLANYAVPAALKGLQNDGALAAGIGQSFPVLHFRGKNWSLKYRGVQKIFVNAHDRTPTQRLDVIILDAALVKSKSYYEKWEEDANKPPLCWSADGKTPDRDVPASTKQCDACELCPRNEWKMQLSGREGRECHDGKKVAVFIMPQQTTLAFGQAVLEAVSLRVPAGSLNNLARYGEWLDQRGLAPAQIITAITFNPEKSHPEMVFGPAEGIPESAADFVANMVKDPVVKRIVGQERFVEGPRTIAAPTTPPLPPTPPPAAVVPQNSPPAASTPNPPMWTPPAPAAAPVDPWAGIPRAGGPGPVIDVPRAQPAVPQPPQQTVADTGKPLEATAELDALVATILAK